MIATRPEKIVRPAKINVASLRAALDDLRAAGILVETDVEVDPILEFAGLQKRMDGGPPVLFNRVKGYPNARLAMNLFSQREMIDSLFGFTNAKDRTKRIAEMIRKPLAPVIVERAHAPSQDVVVTENIRVLDVIVPIKHTAEEEEATVGSGVTLLMGRFFGGGNHVGYNRQNYRWPDKATFQVAPGGHMWMASTESYGKERIPLTINFGIPPAATLAAGAGFDYVVLPYGCDELGVAGALQGAPIELVPAVSIPDAFSIAQAEYVIEGYLDPTEREYETRKSEETKQQGEHPFHPEWAGYMGKAYKAPIFHVTAITHRDLAERPIIQPMIVHGSEENTIQTTVREAALYELADRIMPGFTEDVNIPFAMTDWGGAIFQVKKRNAVDEGYQRNIMVAAMASSRGMRLAIAVDVDIDIYSMDDVMWALTTRVNPQSDILNPVPGGAGQTFQPSERMTAGASERKASNTRFEGGIAFDATFPFGAGEQFARPKYPIEQVELDRWFSKDVIERTHAQQDGWLKLLARTGQ